MEGVIPNSKVVIIPPVDGHAEGGAAWKRELYLRPGEWIPWVTVVVVASMGVLGMIVFVLHLNEKVSRSFLCFRFILSIFDSDFCMCRGKTSWREGGLLIISISMLCSQRSSFERLKFIRTEFRRDTCIRTVHGHTL